MKKISGFTTMELSIVMLMAGLIAAMAYGGYSLFVKQFYRYSHSTDFALNSREVINLLKRDIDQCKTLYGEPGGIFCSNEKNSIVYTFNNDNCILRSQAGRTDTFGIELSAYKFSFQKQSLTGDRAVIDEIILTGQYQKMEFTATFNKQYSNKDRMELVQQNGH